MTRASLDWAGCATFRLTVDDVVVFLDAYLDRVPDAAQSGFTVDAVDNVGGPSMSSVAFTS